MGAESLSMEDSRIKRVAGAIRKHEKRHDALIEILHVVEDVFGFLPLDVLRYLCREMRIPASRVYGVATFYHFFSLKPKGEHNCIVCTGTACHVKGCREVLEKLKEAFGLDPGQVTADKKLGLQTARCLGCCSMAPVAVMDGDILDKPTPDQVVERVRMKAG